MPEINSTVCVIYSFIASYQAIAQLPGYIEINITRHSLFYTPCIPAGYIARINCRRSNNNSISLLREFAFTIIS